MGALACSPPAGARSGTTVTPLPADSVRVFHSSQELADSGFACDTVRIIPLFVKPDMIDVRRLDRQIREAAARAGANGVIEPDLRDLAMPGGPMLPHPPGSLRAIAIRWWRR